MLLFSIYNIENNNSIRIIQYYSLYYKQWLKCACLSYKNEITALKYEINCEALQFDVKIVSNLYNL